MFAPVDSNIIDTLFFVPGTNGGTQATVQGFGAVFTDVDTLGSTTMTFFDLNNNILTGPLPNVPVALWCRTAVSLSWGCCSMPARIARVRIVTGNSALGPNDDPAGGVDVVVIDDVLYREPDAVPEPAVLALVGIGAAAVAARRRRRSI